MKKPRKRPRRFTHSWRKQSGKVALASRKEWANMEHTHLLSKHCEQVAACLDNGQADIMLLYKATEQRVFQSWRLICQCPPSWERRVATVATKHPASKPCCKEISAFEDIGLRFPDFRNAIRRCAALRKQSWEGLFRSFVYTSLLLSLRKTSLNVCTVNRVCQKVLQLQTSPTKAALPPRSWREEWRQQKRATSLATMQKHPEGQTARNVQQNVIHKGSKVPLARVARRKSKNSTARTQTPRLSRVMKVHAAASPLAPTWKLGILTSKSGESNSM